MKKRSKLFISLSMMVLSLGLLVFGVWSAGNVSFNIASNISFDPKGVFVGVSGRVLTGSSVDSLTAVETITERKNFEEGETAGSSIEDWSPADVELSETVTIVRYEFTFTNYSSFNIAVSVSDGENAGSSASLSREEYKDEISNIVEDNYGVYYVTYSLVSFNEPVDLVVDINFSIDKVAEASTYGVAIDWSSCCYDDLNATQPLAVEVKINNEVVNETSAIINKGDKFEIRTLTYEEELDGDIYTYTSVFSAVEITGDSNNTAYQALFASGDWEGLTEWIWENFAGSPIENVSLTFYITSM